VLPEGMISRVGVLSRPVGPPELSPGQVPNLPRDAALGNGPPEEGKSRRATVRVVTTEAIKEVPGLIVPGHIR
jgi:hypothetical protein